MMRRYSFLAVLGIVALPAALLAQGTPIRAGQTISGRLETSDPKLGDGSYYDQYVYQGRAGEQVVITMRSGEFDTYLHWGTLQGDTFNASQTDDDGGGGTDSRITVTLAAAGQYVIRANSLSADKTGPYTLSVESSAGSGPVVAAPVPTPTGGGVLAIAPGQTASGRLDPSDPTLPDSSHYDVYQYMGAPGEQVVVTLRSTDFDTYLTWGHMSGGSFTADTSNDDGGGGTDSQLQITVGNSGNYAIRANSLSGNQTGAYTLSVQRVGTGSVAVRSRIGGPISVGETVTGTITPSDPELSDHSYYHQYRIQGQAGQKVLVTLTSSAFDAYLQWGRLDNNRFVPIGNDDDGGGGTNARAEITFDRDAIYIIRANTFTPGQTGAYTMSVTSSTAQTSGMATVAMGQTVSGRLDTTDPKLGDGSFYDLYVYNGRPGEQILVTMRSRDFDAYMAWGRMVANHFESEQTDDDDGGGTDAQIVATVGSSGTYAIQANSLRANQTGAYTITVAPVSATATTTSTGPRTTTPTGARSVTLGQTVNGVLRQGGPMLSDSSYYDDYVYTGRAGDRLQITLSSSAFDAYLMWGRLGNGQFTQEASDDDSGGGTNASLTVTVGGTGTYTIRANAYAPHAAGAYTLTIAAAAATPVIPASSDGSRTPTRPTTPNSPSTRPNSSSLTGKWVSAYTETSQPQFRAYGENIKRLGSLEGVADALNQQFPLPHNVRVELTGCNGQVNAFYSPRTQNITFCYELLQFLANKFANGSASWTQEQTDEITGAISFILTHEAGHALIDLLNLPAVGREEDAVDQLATFTLVGGGEKGAQGAYYGAAALQPRAGQQYDASDFADEHSLGPQRLYNVMCWIYGSDPRKYSSFVGTGPGMLPRERAARCPGEWDRMSKSWTRLIEGAPYP